MEVWKDIHNYEGLYKVSNCGRIMNAKGNILKARPNNKGYLLIQLMKAGNKKAFTVHRLVALHFLDNPYDYTQVNHKDGNKENNDVSNLEWCNQRLNYDHGMKYFLYSHNENHYFSKLKNVEAAVIPELFKAGFTTTTICKILGIKSSSLRAIILGISYRELNLDFSDVVIQKYKDLPNITLPQNVWEIFKDNTVLNTLIAQGKVSV